MDDEIELLLMGQHFKKFQEAAYSNLVGEYGLTLLDIRVLLFLEKHGAENTAKDIVKIHCFTKSNVSKSIESLLERGYLQKEYDTQDRRRIHLQIQPAAEPIIQRAKKEHEEMLRTVFQGIEKSEMEVIRQVAQKITRNISEAIK